jgi:hypothetical protein
MLIPWFVKSSFQPLNVSVFNQLAFYSHPALSNSTCNGL